MDKKEVLAIILHREVENLMSQIESVESLFQGSTTVTLPLSIHQDMINAYMLEAYFAKFNEEFPPGFDLLKNGAQLKNKAAPKDNSDFDGSDRSYGPPRTDK